MKASKNKRAIATVYLALLCLFCLVGAYQLRISFETLHLERHLDFYVPFLIQEFTDRVDARDYFQSWDQGSQLEAGNHSVLRWRDQILSVNSRPFRGMSVYLRELYRAQHPAPPVPPKVELPPQAAATSKFEWPFVLTVRSSDSCIHRVEVLFAHCTCGRPSAFEAATIWIVPPLFCTLLGFVTVCLRPRAILAWGFLGVMLSLSQFEIGSDLHPGFFNTATPMTWGDWFRVPAVGYRSFVQHAWPGFLLIACTQFYRSRTTAYRLAVAVASSFLLLATVEAALQIAWSEDFRMLVLLHVFMERYRTDFMTVSLAGVMGVAWCLNRKLGLAAVAIGLIGLSALYWSPTPITEGHWYVYADNTTRFVATIPDFHKTTALVALLFATGCLVANLILVRRELSGIEATSLILCLPITVDVAAGLGAYRYRLGAGFSEYWVILGSAGLGLAGITWSVLQRTNPGRALPVTS